jgi:hypothetical protein
MFARLGVCRFCLHSRSWNCVVPLENLEISEWMGVVFLLLFSSMLISLITLLATLSSMFRSRGAVPRQNAVRRECL